MFESAGCHISAELLIVALRYFLQAAAAAKKKGKENCHTSMKTTR